MKHLISILLFLSIVFSTFAQSFQYTQANLNLRKGPGTHNSIILTIPQGASVKIDKTKQNYFTWSFVTYKGVSGYVYNNYLGNTTPKHSSNSWFSASSNSTQKTIKSYNSSGEKKFYTNSKGVKVQSPTFYKSTPSGATAICRDGTYSFSRSRRGTCSHHGGVARWL